VAKKMTEHKLSTEQREYHVGNKKRKRPITLSSCKLFDDIGVLRGPNKKYNIKSGFIEFSIHK
jgi:hypothetical protein